MSNQKAMTTTTGAAPAVVVEAPRLKHLLSTPAIKQRFEEVLGKKAAAFMSSIITVTQSSKSLQQCDPNSVLSAAAIAASLDLPINQSLGFAHIVPYKEKAQFQIGWKGIIQLAMRSGQYKTINTTVVYEGQLVKNNPFTGEMEFQNEAKSEKVVGYLLYFKLLNGFEKYFYMTREEMERHAKRYSRSYSGGYQSVWKDDFDAMGLKTVAKLGLSKFGILSVELQKAVEVDQSVVDDKGEPRDYPDSPEKKEGATPEQDSTKPAKATAALSVPAPDGQAPGDDSIPL